MLQKIVGEKWGIYPSREDVHRRLFEMIQSGFEPRPLEQQGNAFDWLCTYVYFGITNQFKRKSKPDDTETTGPQAMAGNPEESEYFIKLFKQAMEQVKGEFKRRVWKMYFQANFLKRPAKDVVEEMGVGSLTVYRAARRISKRLRDVYRLLDEANRAKGPDLDGPQK